MDSNSSNCIRLSTLVLITSGILYNAEIFLPDTPSRTTYQIMYLFGIMAAGTVVIFIGVQQFCLISHFPVLGTGLPAGGTAFYRWVYCTDHVPEINLIHAAMVTGVEP
jgi:hypothetical protein